MDEHSIDECPIARGNDKFPYDPLNRLTYFQRGTLSSSGHNGSSLDTIAAPSTTNPWH